MQYKQKSYLRRWKKQFYVYLILIDEDLFELCFRPVNKKWFRENVVLSTVEFGNLDTFSPSIFWYIICKTLKHLWSKKKILNFLKFYSCLTL